MKIDELYFLACLFSALTSRCIGSVSSPCLVGLTSTFYSSTIDRSMFHPLLDHIIISAILIFFFLILFVVSGAKSTFLLVQLKQC